MQNTEQNIAGGYPAQSQNHKRVIVFLKRQGVALYFIAGVFVVTALFFAFYVIKKNRDNEQASRLLGMAQTSKQFDELFRQYPNSAAAPVALLALASARFSAGDYDGAIGRYVEFAAKYPQHPLASAAELGKIMCSEAKGEIEKALMGFDAFITVHPDHFLTPQAIFGKARCLHLAGKLSEAKVVYEDFIAANPEGKWRQHAEAALLMLDRQIRHKQNASQRKKLQ